MLAAAGLFTFLSLSASAIAGLECVCVGDCDGNGRVMVDELVVSVGIALEDQSPTMCGAADPNGDDRVSVDELTQAVHQGLTNCSDRRLPACDCEDDSQCASGYCRDKRCCDQGCFGARCDLPNREGQCTALLRNGARCLFDAECFSEICHDREGVCCNTECLQPGQFCAPSGTCRIR